ncbi:peptide chain release factor N(5)-glutamine methyltransferase [Cohaesibacter haloalkalitolerans]|uniref:peptide chain release factor N(5)-glutamine methyltransferase n=1 Tax=Cohaesibacter haloalkalitolerans TaxID=1162980 RepID=UPI000E65B621|nr:peptide chain release factor N(5)-glutamine methyltransferase [Cohaesibacter haloalkalitolerans]
MRLDQKIAEMARRLADEGIETARLDARLLASHGLSLSETDIILQFDRSLDADEMALLDAFIARRAEREPIAHILGYREFWGLDFKVTKDTLVPRPDSETLVAGVLDRIADKRAPLKLVDIGTGTGCLLLSLLSELPNARGVGSDISPAALAVAQENAQSLGLSGRVAFVEASYADAFAGGMDILISNPPYLAETEMADIERDVADYDPLGALVSGATGLEAYEAIFAAIASWQQKPSLMAFEFGYRQAAAVKSLAQVHGLAEENDTHCHILQDLGGQNRILLLETHPI